MYSLSIWPVEHALRVPVYSASLGHLGRVKSFHVQNVLILQGAAELVGKRIGELCLEKNISKVSFDRGGNIYHGRVQVCLAARL